MHLSFRTSHQPVKIMAKQFIDSFMLNVLKDRRARRRAVTIKTAMQDLQVALAEASAVGHVMKHRGKPVTGSFAS